MRLRSWHGLPWLTDCEGGLTPAGQRLLPRARGACPTPGLPVPGSPGPLAFPAAARVARATGKGVKNRELGTGSWGRGVGKRE